MTCSPSSVPCMDENAILGGDWGTALVQFEGRTLTLNLEPSFIGQSRTSTYVSVQNCVPHPQPPLSNLAANLDKGVDNTLSRISFGMQEMFEGFVRGRSRILGFEFVQLELSCTNLEHGNLENQLVIGVKILAVGDVSSAFILAQELIIPWDRTETMIQKRPLQNGPDSLQDYVEDRMEIC
jgi:hypothetical protein